MPKVLYKRPHFRGFNANKVKLKPGSDRNPSVNDVDEKLWAAVESSDGDIIEALKKEGALEVVRSKQG